MLFVGDGMKKSILILFFILMGLNIFSKEKHNTLTKRNNEREVVR